MDAIHVCACVKFVRGFPQHDAIMRVCVCVARGLVCYFERMNGTTYIRHGPRGLHLCGHVEVYTYLLPSGSGSCRSVPRNSPYYPQYVTCYEVTL